MIVHSSIPPWMIYFYWASPFAYGVRALGVNEMTSPRWAVAGPNGEPLGRTVLGAFDIYHDR